MFLVFGLGFLGFLGFLGVFALGFFDFVFGFCSCLVLVFCDFFYVLGFGFLVWGF